MRFNPDEPLNIVAMRRAQQLCVAMVLGCALVARLGAQSPDTAGLRNAESAALRQLRMCPRVTCELTLERGTLKGAQLRLGQSGARLPMGYMGTRVIRHLSLMPEAAAEARRARGALRVRMVVAALTLAGVVTVASYGWHQPFADAYERREYAAPAVSMRIFAAAVVAGTGMFVAERQSRSAMRHLDEAVRRYNDQLPR